MKKIPSVFKRNYETDRLIRDEVVDGCEWVGNGEGYATRKWDGTSCLIKDGKIFARYDCKKNKQPPVGFIPAQEPDPVTGHWTGWLKCSDNPSQYKFHLQAFQTGKDYDGNAFEDGATYELCGEKIQKNPENITGHILIKHGNVILSDCPRTFEGIKEYLSDKDIEGVVFWNTDGRMAKVKKKDYGLKRKEDASCNTN